MIPFESTDWNTIPSTMQQGEKGYATIKTKEYKNFRIRLIEYSAQYLADHWCKLGHIAYCLHGTFDVMLSDGKVFSFTAGMSFQVSNNASSHKVKTESGALVLIIDGHALK